MVADYIISINSLRVMNVLISQAPELVFKPSLEHDSPDSFHSLVDSLLDDIFNFTTLVPRVAKHKDLSDYHSDVEEVSFPEIITVIK